MVISTHDYIKFINRPERPADNKISDFGGENETSDGPDWL